MSEPRCTACNAVLIPGAGFCRQCGLRVIESAGIEEQPTAILNPATDGLTTQRLDPRATSPGYRDSAAAIPPERSRSGRRRLILIGLIGTLLGVGLVVFATLSLLKTRSRSAAQVSRSLIYPGAKTVLDLTYDDGSAVLQLQTPDPLDKVQPWYETNLKPTKTLRATSGSVIMKNDALTATLVAEDSLTTIVIKKANR
jgi:hypothetical protein